MTSAEDTGAGDVAAAAARSTAEGDDSEAGADKCGSSDAYQTDSPSGTQTRRGWQGWSHVREEVVEEATEGSISL